MRGFHMRLPEVPAFPDFVEDKETGRFVIDVKVILQAPLLGAGDGDQPLQLGSYELFLACDCGDLGQDDQRHDTVSF